MAENSCRALIDAVSEKGIFVHIYPRNILTESFELARKYLGTSPSEDAVFNAIFYLYIADSFGSEHGREELVVYSLREMAGLKSTNEARGVYRKLKME